MLSSPIPSSAKNPRRWNILSQNWHDPQDIGSFNSVGQQGQVVCRIIQGGCKERHARWKFPSSLLGLLCWNKSSDHKHESERSVPIARTNTSLCNIWWGRRHFKHISIWLVWMVIFSRYHGKFPFPSYVLGLFLGPANNEVNEMAQWFLKQNGKIVPRQKMRKLTQDELVRESEIKKWDGFDAAIKIRYGYSFALSTRIELREALNM